MTTVSDTTSLSHLMGAGCSPSTDSFVAPSRTREAMNAVSNAVGTNMAIDGKASRGLMVGSIRGVSSTTIEVVTTIAAAVMP